MTESRPGQDGTRRDPLTGLPGMESLRSRLDDWRDAADISGEPIKLHALLLDLARFDALNLAYGEAAGDTVLTIIASRLSNFAARELDGPWVAARSGGGSFILAANHPCSRERWQLLATQLSDLVARPILTASGTLHPTPKVALLRAVGYESAETLLDRLGQTMGAMRAHQARRLAWADGETARPGRTAAQLEADLLRAIDGDEIEVVFQPQYALADDRLVGGEALARWNHPKLGRIGAGALFAIAERAEHIAPLSRRIAELGLDAASRWPDRLRVSLNVTAFELGDPTYAEEMAGIIAQSGVAPGRVTLEVTEQALVSDISLAARSLEKLESGGLRIALDDFGAGFCNFRYLKLLPLRYLKLDRSMIDGITHDPRDLAVLRAIIAMAKALNLGVIAEGVESDSQRAVLADEHCDFYQGFLRSRPLNADDFQLLTNS